MILLSFLFRSPPTQSSLKNCQKKRLSLQRWSTSLMTMRRKTARKKKLKKRAWLRNNYP